MGLKDEWSGAIRGRLYLGRNRTKVGLKDPYLKILAAAAESRNRTKVGLKALVGPWVITCRTLPQSNQGGIESGHIGVHLLCQPPRRNRTKVGLKEKELARIRASGGAAIEPRWD